MPNTENLEASQHHKGFEPPQNPPPHHSHPPFEERFGKNGMPLRIPPINEPHKPPSTFAIDHGAIRNCVGKYTFIWLNDGSSFWMYPTHIGRRSIAGYRYGRRSGWVYYGTDLDNIESFYCVPY